MKRLSVVLLSLLLAASLCSAATVDEGVYRRMASVIQWYYGASAAESQMYVGSEMCLACHPSKSGWRDSMHATGFNVTDTSAFSLQKMHGIVADYDRNNIDDFIDGLDFNQISSAFDKYKPNAPILSYSDATGYQIQIGQLTYPVKFAYGGSGLYKQRYVLKIPVTDRGDGLSAGHYVGPVSYNEKSHEYVTYHPEDWYNTDNTPRFGTGTTTTEAAKGRSFDKKCSGCHFTGLAIWKDGNGEYRAEAPVSTLYFPNDPHYYDFNGDRIKEHINTGCERCHGAGSMHVLGRGDPEQIINPETDWTKEQATTLCGSCHNRGKSMPEGVYDYPFDESTNTPYANALGESLDRFYEPKPGMWPDGKTSKSHRQQYLDMKASGHPTTCFDCHDPHANSKHLMRDEIEYEGVTVPAENDNNTLCLACHAGHHPFEDLTTQDIANYDANVLKIGTETSKHTNHTYRPEGKVGVSRCSKCHFAKTAKSAVAYDIHGHTFEVIPPTKNLIYQAEGGMPNSCAVGCHRPMAEIFKLPMDLNLTQWNEASDVARDKWLETYYGPSGKWWTTGEHEQ